MPGRRVLPALSLLPVLSTEGPLDGKYQEKLALGPLAAPSVWAHPSPSLPQFPSCSGSRASPFLFRALSAASCPQCSGCSPTGLPRASLPRQVGMGRVISSPRPVAGCWYPGQCWGTRSIPECSPGNSGVVGVLANPHPSQLCTGASACSPKGPGNQKLNLAWSRVSLKLVPVCEERRVWVQGHHPLPAELLPLDGENHAPLPRGLQLWGGEEEPKMSPSVGQGGHMSTLSFAGHLEPCWPRLAWGPI